MQTRPSLRTRVPLFLSLLAFAVAQWLDEDAAARDVLEYAALVFLVATVVGFAADWRARREAAS